MSTLDTKSYYYEYSTASKPYCAVPATVTHQWSLVLNGRFNTSDSVSHIYVMTKLYYYTTSKVIEMTQLFTRQM